MKTKDLTPQFTIPTAEEELVLLPIQTPIGQQQGGLSMFSNKFRRGSGNAVFGSDENGIWLGAADFADAVFSVSMEGLATFKGQGAGTAGIFINAEDKTIIVNDGTNDRVLIGEF